MDFDELFLSQLKTHDFTPICKPGKMQAGRRVAFSENRWTRLHLEKVSMTVFGELNSRGLACPLGRDWWAVEKGVAELYMGYFVGSICRADRNLFPVTDSEDSLHSLIEPIGGQAASRLRRLQYSTITQALPVPSRLVDADELASFKDRHGDKLRRLRHHLNGQLADLATIDDDFVRDTKTESILQEIQDDVAVLVEQMQKRRWPRIVFVGVGGLIASAAAVGLTVASGGAALALGLGITAGVASMGPAGYQVVDLIRSPRFDEHSPLAYAALAQAL